MIIGFKYNSIYYIGLLFAISVCLVGVSPVLGQSDAELKIDDPEFDFGIVPGGFALEMRTWIRSAGTDGLEIAEIKTGCACISSSTEKQLLAPGDSTEISLIWSVRDTAGVASRRVYLFTNAGPGVAAIDLTATVGGFGEDERFKVSPGWIRISPNQGRARKLRLINELGEPCYVNPVLIGRGIELQVPDSVGAGESGTIQLEIELDAVNQSIETSFTLEISAGSGYSRRITVPVTVGDFSYKPAYLRTSKKK